MPHLRKRHVTLQLGLHQVIKEPTYILHNSFSCIDLIFASQPNLVGKKVYNSKNINRTEQRKINTNTIKLTNKQTKKHIGKLTK